MIKVEKGTVIGGRFVVESTIGQGGMGMVLKARDNRLARTVAIKYIAAGGENDTARARLLREARAAAALSHPNVIAVHDVGETDEGDVYVVMELVRGRTLRQWLQEGVQATVSRRLRVIVDTARALGAAHAINVVHRDVKPDNVMVREDGRVVVLDFGIAKRLPGSESQSGSMSAMTGPGMVMGTPAYLSPEQIQGSELDGRADQFALAVTAYEFLTGQLPWNARKPVALMGEVLLRDPDPPSRVRSAIPESVDAVILRAMSKTREGRFESIDAFADALEPFAASEESMLRSVPEMPAVRSDAPVTPVTPAESVRSEMASAPTVASVSQPDTATETHRVTAPPTPSAVEIVPRESVPAAPQPDAPTPLVASGPAPAPAPQTKIPPLMLVALVGALTAIGLFVAATLWRRSHADRGAMTDAPDAVLACPIFEVGGDVPAPSGWLGAAAASVVCARASDAMGGAVQRTLIPAQLIELSSTPTDGFPVDPYADPSTRTRSMLAARARATVWLDGRVTRDPAGVHLTATAHARDGRTATARATGEDLFDATRRLIAELTRASVLPKAPTLSAYGRDAEGASDLASLQAWRRHFEDEDRGLLASAEEGCGRVRNHPEVFGSLLPLVRVECQLQHFIPGPMVPVTIDRSTPGRFALTARYHVVSGGRTDPRALADGLHAAQAQTSDPRVRSLLAESEAEMWQTLGQAERARAVALVAVELDPRSHEAWGRLNSIALDDPSAAAVIRAMAAWLPDRPLSWRWMGVEFPHQAAPLETRLRMVERAYVLSPNSWPALGLYSRLLIESGEVERARQVLARLRDREEGGTVRAVLEVSNESSEARFETALRDAMASLTAPTVTELGTSQTTLAERALELSEILGKRAEVADALARRFVTPTLHLEQFGTTAVMALSFCTYASPEVQRACFASFGEAVRARRFLALLPSFGAVREGAERYVAGDVTGATNVWRPVVRDAFTTMRLLQPAMVDAFDRAGQHDLAEQIDASRLGDLHAFGGATPAHVRSARRAAARGDRARARTLAQTVVSAWLTAEGPPVCLPEMQALASGAGVIAATGSPSR